MVKAISHPLFARIYPKINAYAEAHGSVEHRQELLAGVRGRVVEIGAGTGANFRHYPPEVERVIAVEPEPRLRALAERAVADAAAPVEVLAGQAERLPVEDGSVDVAVVSLVLCTIVDVPGALAEVSRVLRPTGELRFYEHVRAQKPHTARPNRFAGVVFPLPISEDSLMPARLLSIPAVAAALDVDRRSAGAPSRGSSRSHQFATIAGRGTPGASSKRRSSSTMTGMGLAESSWLAVTGVRIRPFVMV
ncbi:class I SAM-dependent methyltransferase [Streptomyces benahoarensis]|uniref:class I SAM-dependent methyltransferase n=1 Tax=Streptomyces benahoarensis TaxID=2595054 RepID=UPI0020365516|nr:class I SAM-dependent methyltransferase [Streptomyces benahoarensis]